MRYFLVEGIIRAAENMDDAIMTQHMAYTQKAMDQGSILISGLKADMGGGVFIIRTGTADQLESILTMNHLNCMASRTTDGWSLPPTM